MIRREFITLLGGAAAAWPLAARAQQDARIRRLGMVTGITDEAGTRARYAAFFAELARLGWMEGRNLRSIIAGVKAAPTRYARTLPSWQRSHLM